MGYAKEIVRQLPVRFQADFPAVLTHRSGFSTPLVRSLRPLFQNATGPHRMNQILRIRHTEVYDIAQLQYYDVVAETMERRSKEAQLAGIRNYKDQNNYPEFSSFSDPNGYNGYVPSASYISYVYCSIITELRPYMDQHQSLLDGKILKGDHSFKIIKKMNKSNGVSDYSCMYTVMNEYEEIKMQILAPTKSLKHVVPSFVNMMASYKKYGFELPELFYTDNVIGDRSTLEEVMPSLTENVKHLNPTKSEQITINNQYATLPPAEIPDSVEVVTLDTADGINVCCQYLLDEAHCNTSSIYIGFDCEWAYQGSVIPLDERLSVKYIDVSLVQIAYKSVIYLMRIHKFDRETFPRKLEEILLNKNITKLGRGVAGDLGKFKYFGITGCTGQQEIGTLCKDKDLVTNGHSSLSNLCGEVLGLYLPKVPQIRCGNWEASLLSEEQKKYAALDAWVSLEMYNKCKSLPTVNVKVYESTTVGTLVSIHIDKGKKNSSIAGYGYIQHKGTSSTAHEDKEKSPIKKTTVSMKLVKTLIPGFALDCYFPEVTLGDFEENSVVHINRNYLFTASSKRLSESSSTIQRIVEITDQTTESTNSSVSTIPSRILRDVFHVLDLIKVKLSHGMAKDFIRRLRDAFLVFDPLDKANVKSYLNSIGSDWKSHLLTNPDFVFKRVKRHIPPPEKLLHTVKFLFDKYGPLKCSKTNLPLFDEEAKRTAEKILASIELGHISDLTDGPPLYTEKGFDKNGLMTYKCSRGTNSVEGSCHMNVIRRFASYNASTRLTDAVLADYRLYHNINVSICIWFIITNFLLLLL
jgi:hypothetical protein